MFQKNSDIFVDEDVDISETTFLPSADILAEINKLMEASEAID